MEQKMQYKSVHEYMDALFRGRNPSDKQVKDAKEAYRRIYQKHYRETYNRNLVQITFRISRKEYRELELFAQQKGIKVTKLAKNRTLKTGENHTVELKIQLSELIDVIEEAIYKNRVIDLASILKHLETIEALL